jgi:hypothetical protein
MRGRKIYKIHLPKKESSKEEITKNTSLSLWSKTDIDIFSEDCGSATFEIPQQSKRRISDANGVFIKCIIITSDAIQNAYKNATDPFPRCLCMKLCGKTSFVIHPRDHLSFVDLLFCRFVYYTLLLLLCWVIVQFKSFCLPDGTDN